MPEFAAVMPSSPFGPVAVVDMTSLYSADFRRVHFVCRRCTNVHMSGRPMKREYDFRKAKRGPVVPVPKGKTRITIRLDDDILAWFRDQVELAGGGNYQTVINEVLR